MINLYTTTSCVSCRKAKAWLEEHQIDYIERNLSYEPITEDEIKKILSMTEKVQMKLFLQGQRFLKS